MSQPAGGMVLWIELPPRVSSLELYRRALAEGITLVPGPVFSARRRLDRFIRLSTGLEWNGRVEAALVRLGQLVSEMA